jgi:uncharacterized protein (TIGR03435 family)
VNLRKSITASIAPAIFLLGFVAAQIPSWAQPATQRTQQTFDVSVIKPSSPDLTMMQTTWDPQRLLGRGVSLKGLIQWAYQVTDAQVAGAAGWIDSKRYDFEAKAEGSHTRDELVQMLQSLLAERFKLALHRETKEQQAYVLATGKKTLNLQEAQPGRPASIAMQPGPGPGDSIVLKITGQSVSMRYLTDYLTNIVGRVVVDRTNLTGSFDFQAQESWSPSPNSDKRTLVTDALLDAMSQLGFNLSSQRIPIEILVVDHAEEPTEN